MADEHPLEALTTPPRLLHGRWGMGWKPDRPDMNRRYGMPPLPVAAIPEHTDLRQTYRFPVWDQGKLGSCTAQAIVAALQFGLCTTRDEARRVREFTGSRLQLYYNERWWEGTTASDAGAAIADGMQILNWIGIAPESEWPYDIARWADRPPAHTYALGFRHKVRGCHAVPQTRFAIQSHLAADIPVIFGCTVYESFESAEVASTGIVRVPEQGERMLGGHAMLIMGHDALSGTYLVRNSWGQDWGQVGYCAMPMDYIESVDLAGSLWALEGPDI